MALIGCQVLNEIKKFMKNVKENTLLETNLKPLQDFWEY